MLSKNITFIKINICWLFLACLTLFLQSCGKGVSELESLSRTNLINNNATNSNGTSPTTPSTVTEILPPSSSTGGLISLFYQNLVAPITFPTPTFGTFYSPNSLARDSSGNLYLAEGNQLVRKISPTGEVTTIAGNGNVGCTNGVGTAASFTSQQMVRDSSGNFYVGGHNTIRKITPDGVVSTYSGGTCLSASAIVDGTSNTARFNSIGSMAIDSAGIICVEDEDKVIRRVDTNGDVLTIAGDVTTVGYADGVGGAARFWNIGGIALDAVSDLYVSDIVNRVIRKVVLNPVTHIGTVTTIAGIAGVPGSIDGAIGVATFSRPMGIAIDPSGIIYVADTNTHTIRKIDTIGGTVSTFVGGGLGAVDGTGTAAQFYAPHSMVFDQDGNLYLTDGGNSFDPKNHPRWRCYNSWWCNSRT